MEFGDDGVAMSLKDKTIIVTGATGFLAKGTVFFLYFIVHTHLLIRCVASVSFGCCCLSFRGEGSESATGGEEALSSDASF